jgi:hypothetical protein
MLISEPLEALAAKQLEEALRELVDALMRPKSAAPRAMPEGRAKFAQYQCLHWRQRRPRSWTLEGG